MKSELTNFTYRIVDIVTEGEEPLIEAALNHISTSLKTMDTMRYMDMDYERETIVRLEFDEIEVSSLIIFIRSVAIARLTLLLKDEQGQVIS